MYNLSNLEPKFKSFLRAENISAITLRNYLSDVRHFLGWLISIVKKDRKNDFEETIKSISPQIVEKYKNDHIKSALPIKTINRRLSALRKFFLFCQKEALIEQNPAKMVNNISLVKNVEKPDKQDTIGKIQQPVELQPKIKAKSWTRILFKPSRILFFLTAFIFSLLGLFFSNIFKTPKYEITTVDATQANKRYLAFNARLADSLGNPITNKTDVTFRLYNTPSRGEALYTSSCIGQNGAINPRVDGKIDVLIGSDCDGNPIPANLFSDNPNVYLGITVSADSEMMPRQHIPNLGYAQEADTIAGLTVGSEISTIPYINDNGELLIASTNPGVRSTYESSNFTLSSTETITVQSAKTGDVVLQATDSGTIKLRTGGFSDFYTRLFINDGGNVGIGTLLPNYSLEVSGDIKIGDGSRLILGSSYSDPVGINGSIYYNTSLNRVRCFQNGIWSNCVEKMDSPDKKIGGYEDRIAQKNEYQYEGNPTQTEIDNMRLKFEIETSKITSKITDTLDLISTAIKTAYVDTENAVINNSLLAKNILSENVSSLLTTSYQLLATNISVREKITSPIIETTDLVATGTAQIAKIETSEIRPQDGNLILDLSSDNQVRTPGVGEFAEGEGKTSGVNGNGEKGPLASLIIRGLEGKTVASIDAAGNASFSGQLASNSLLINSDATISGQLTAENIRGNQLEISGNLSATEATLSGKLIAKEIESDNIKSIEDRLNVIASEAKQSQLNGIATSSTSSPPRNDNELNNQINDIQKLLAEIKNQPLADPQYYQNLPAEVIIASGSEAISSSSGIAASPSAPRNDLFESLTVTGNSNLYNLSVTGSGAIGNLLIQDNSILSLAWDLKLSSLSTINLFENAVVISKDGTIVTKGKVIAEDGIKTNKIEPIKEGEQVTIDNLAIDNLSIKDKYLESSSSSAVIASSDNFERNGISSPAIEAQTATAGNGRIPENSQEIIIYNNKVKNDSLIYLTPTNAAPSGNITVVKKEPCSLTSEVEEDPELVEGDGKTSEVDSKCKPYFKVAVDKPEDSPILFNWLIIN